MSEYTRNELEWLKANSPYSLDQKDIKGICKAQYSSNENRLFVCKYIRDFLKAPFNSERIELGNAGFIAEFWELCNYREGVSFLISQRNIVEQQLENKAIHYRLKDADKRALKVIKNAIDSLNTLPAKNIPDIEKQAYHEYDVFLSYSSLNESEAMELIDQLKNQDISFFFAKKSLSGGDDFSNVIKDSLINSREIWILITPDSLNSEWVITEWGAAWALNKRIVPILLRCSPSQLPERLKRLHSVDYHRTDKLILEFKERCV